MAIGGGLVLAVGLATGVSQWAGAAPQETVSQAQSQVNALQAKSDKATEQYDATTTQVNQAKSRLAQVTAEQTADNKKYQAARKQFVQIANASYMDSGATSLAGLLTTSDPGTVLSEASILSELTSQRDAETTAFLADARALVSVQGQRKRTLSGISALQKKQHAQLDSINSSLSKQKTILANLTAAQRQQVEQNSVGGNSSTAITHASYTGPTGTQADAAVKFVYDQLGCQYTYGATGPCSVGFDCSGLMQAAWASAGVTIPRDTYEQWAALPHISVNDIQPGDLLYYDGIGHVAMYVGGGYIIDAPHTGAVVEKVPQSESWYADNFDGAAVP
ncbi:MAG TPA: NlpC/P60 family protein [Trebonia sp.]|nr:NlpC/P60 family protein [Trebonia sp.]